MEEEKACRLCRKWCCGCVLWTWPGGGSNLDWLSSSSSPCFLFSALPAVSSSYVETKHFKPLSFDSVVTSIYQPKIWVQVQFKILYYYCFLQTLGKQRPALATPPSRGTTLNKHSHTRWNSLTKKKKMHHILFLLLWSKFWSMFCKEKQ